MTFLEEGFGPTGLLSVGAPFEIPSVDGVRRMFDEPSPIVFSPLPAFFPCPAWFDFMALMHLSSHIGGGGGKGTGGGGGEGGNGGE
mmetsp:Transcript_29417/g.56487  ORF Transcript_29417/g.56487 Transcript_29417/m.56487 type:complete len:86 (+) Transcript_29417:275-532(+)|eukprot:CAMPEP_0114252954 /NCGR_PEP_ID=MMETSP0058-20121206/16125_1 /TAXON_ID=36894 /ORGANISM="Pyramimonas parkeae, CCMP726" /LENGTH=85 /DNA_ID=CAMNT_0001366949 /DNA_START=255 /DNA_END=512 /DNA_ORIENTATION=+